MRLGVVTGVSEETIATILAATEDIILRSGSDRVSILEV
jgi:hypothetical protein